MASLPSSRLSIVVNAEGTPLQVATNLIGEALRIAREDARTHAVFVDLAARIVAREAARRLEDEWQEAA
jgi:hypothetical protein